MFWKNLAKVFAAIGSGALNAALWTSQHPEVVQLVSTVAVSAGAKASTVAKVDQGVTIAGEIATDATSKKTQQ